MQIGELAKRGWAATLAVVLAGTLAGCSPLPPGYVVNPGAGEPLELRSVCNGNRFSAVWVVYVINGDPSAYEAQEPLWRVEFPEGSEPAVVLLFEDNPGGMSEFGQADIDWDRDMAVTFESEIGSGRGVVGYLGDLAPGDVIWNGGVEALDVFEEKAPDRAFGC
jgi:hypothetical protein